MSINCIVQQTTNHLPKTNVSPSIISSVELTPSEIDEIALYTVQKINNYPKSFGKTVENYFDLLFPDEVKNYQTRRAINNNSFLDTDKEGDANGK